VSQHGQLRTFDVGVQFVDILRAEGAGHDNSIQRTAGRRYCLNASRISIYFFNDRIIASSAFIIVRGIGCGSFGPGSAVFTETSRPFFLRLGPVGVYSSEYGPQPIH
jgi:hypothetical protein